MLTLEGIQLCFLLVTKFGISWGTDICVMVVGSVRVQDSDRAGGQGFCKRPEYDAGLANKAISKAKGSGYVRNRGRDACSTPCKSGIGMAAHHTVEYQHTAEYLCNILLCQGCCTDRLQAESSPMRAEQTGPC